MEDLGSMNGTRLDGARLGRGERRAFSRSSVLEIGSVSFLLQQRAHSVSQELEEAQRAVDPTWDVEKLAVVYSELAADMFGLHRPRLTEEVMRAICDYPWGVGSSEIKGVLYRAVLVAQGEEIRLEHLKLADRRRPVAANSHETPATLEDLGADVEIVERERLRQALRQANGSCRLAPRTLGMPQGVFRQGARACGIELADEA